MSVQPPNPPQQPLPVQPLTPQEERMWGMLCHLSALAMLILPTLGNIIGPLIIWLIKKDASPFVNDQGKASLNFQISCTIYGAVAVVLGIPLSLALGFLMPVFFLPMWGVLAFAVMIFDVVEVIIASMAVNSGGTHKYPLTIRFIS
jgi:uncharacterized Tic20 family protein